MLGSLLMVWVGWSPQVGHLLGIGYTSPYTVPLQHISQLIDWFANSKLQSVSVVETLTLTPTNTASLSAFPTLPKPIKFSIPSLPEWNLIQVALVGAALQGLWWFLSYPAIPLTKSHLVGKMISALFWALISWEIPPSWASSEFSLGPLIYSYNVMVTSWFFSAIYQRPFCASLLPYHLFANAFWSF